MVHSTALGAGTAGQVLVGRGSASRTPDDLQRGKSQPGWRLLRCWNNNDEVDSRQKLWWWS